VQLIAMQLYISPPASANSPPQLLRGFDSVFLAPGASTTVSFSLSRYDLSIWNVVTQYVYFLKTNIHAHLVVGAGKSLLGRMVCQILSAVPNKANLAHCQVLRSVPARVTTGC
jgi:hypothetical protein